MTAEIFLIPTTADIYRQSDIDLLYKPSYFNGFDFASQFKNPAKMFKKPLKNPQKSSIIFIIGITKMKQAAVFRQNLCGGNENG